MTITNTYRWNGKLGSEWTALVPPPNPKSNWDNLGNPSADPSYPSGAGDLAVIDLGGAVNITASNGSGVPEEMQVVNASTVTFSSGHFDTGSDGTGGMLIDEDAALILTSSGSMADGGSLDIVGLTGNGTLTLQPGAGFDDLGMIIGADANAHGEVTADAPFGFEIVQSGPGATDGVLVVGEDGDGTVDISDTQIFFSATAILGKNDGSNGVVNLNNVTWGGSTLTIGPAGTGVANVGPGSTVAMASIVVGPNGLLNVTGAGTTEGVVLGPVLSLAFGTIDVTGGGVVLMGAPSGPSGAISIGGTDLTGLGTVKGDVDLTGGTVVATGPAPGALMIDGNIHGTGMIEPLMTLEVNGGIAAGVDIAFSPSIGAQVGDLVLDVPSADLGTITGFDVGNTIDIQGSLYSAALFTQGATGDAGTLTLSGGTSAPLSLLVLGTYDSNSFVATPGTTDTIVTLVPCFVAGTRIRAERGNIPVEALRAGDRIHVLRGDEAKPVVWLGHRRIDCSRHPVPAQVWPIRVSAGAIGPGRPFRDLFLSPDHALYMGGTLVPVRYLLNGSTIVQQRSHEVTYWHVELAEHNVLYAEGVPAESYLDTGNRAAFENGSTAAVAVARA